MLLFHYCEVRLYDLGYGGTLVFLNTENLTGHPHLSNDFIRCDSGECAVSYYTSQMIWDMVELWFSLKQLDYRGSTPPALSLGRGRSVNGVIYAVYVTIVSLLQLDLLQLD